MQYLDYIETKFDKLSLLIKFELFLIPILIVFFIQLFDEDISQKNLLNNNINVENLQMKTKLVNIVKDIESFLNKNKIFIVELSNKQNQIKAVIKTENEKQFLEFLVFLEKYNSYSKITSVEKVADIKTIVITFDKFYVKKEFNLNNLLLKLEEEKTKKSFFKLYAIVDKKVFIGDSWFNIGDMIGDYKVIKINNESVFIKNKIHTLKLELFDE